MNRRAFLSAVTAGLLAAPLAAETQGSWFKSRPRNHL
jgi:hypothetical protein